MDLVISKNQIIKLDYDSGVMLVDYYSEQKRTISKTSVSLTPKKAVQLIELLSQYVKGKI